MKKIENECVGCPPETGCMGSVCPNRNAVHFYCDDCGGEEDLYYFDDKELCLFCIVKRLEMVKTN